MNYLMIENKGTFGTSLMSVVGASTSRGNSAMIGQFGSGGSFAIALCMRESCDIKYTSSKDVFEFGVIEEDALDVQGNTHAIRQVVMKQVGGSSRKTRTTGFDMSFGAVDWLDISMSLREFISNACDASMSLQGNYEGVRVELVDDPVKFARDGYTRIWVQANDKVKRYFNELHANFPLLRKGFDVNQVIMPKAIPSPLRVYRKGVLVGGFEKNSLMDYNLNTIELKESRTISEYAAKAAVAKAIKHAEPGQIVRILEAIQEDRDVFEVKELDLSDLQVWDWEKSYNPTLVKNWSEAVKEAFGTAVACESTHEAELVGRKGYKPVVLDQTMRNVLKSYEMKTADDVLDSFEQRGMQTFPLDEEQGEKVRGIWDLLVEIGVTKGKDMPPVLGFHDIMDAGTVMNGYYNPRMDVIGLNGDVLDSRLEFTQKLLEEFAHYISKATDCTRDLQDLAFKIAALMINRGS